MVNETKDWILDQEFMAWFNARGYSLGNERTVYAAWLAGIAHGLDRNDHLDSEEN
jgi:hypothetical protein